MYNENDDVHISPSVFCSKPTMSVLVLTPTIAPDEGSSSVPPAGGPNFVRPSLRPPSITPPTPPPIEPASPTMPPPPPPDSLVWEQTGSFEGPSGFGVSVAIGGGIMAAGAPGGFGEVQTFRFENDEWSPFSTLNGTQQTGRFGTSVVLNPDGDSLAVGAPGVYARNSLTSTGAVFFYQLDPNEDGWVSLGEIRGDENRYTENELFGFSIGMDRKSNILAVGAPFSNEGSVNKVGRVYTFRYSSRTEEWSPRQSLPVVGGQSGDLLGYAVDLSGDGSILVAGGIGRANGAGYITVYQWIGDEWLSVATFAGSEAGEGFGTSVKVLSDDGQYIAAGGPGFGGNQGVIRVYKRKGGFPYDLLKGGTSLHYELLGEIQGDPGDALGDQESLAGMATPGPVLFASTGGGLVKRFEYDDESQSFVESASPLSVTFAESPALDASSPSSVVAGGRNEVGTFALVEV
jgi:hypothetical protein